MIPDLAVIPLTVFWFFFSFTVVQKWYTWWIYVLTKPLYSENIWWKISIFDLGCFQFMMVFSEYNPIVNEGAPVSNTSVKGTWQGLINVRGCSPTHCRRVGQWVYLPKSRLKTSPASYRFPLKSTGSQVWPKHSCSFKYHEWLLQMGSLESTE